MGYMFMPDKTAETIDEDGEHPLPPPLLLLLLLIGRGKD